MSLSIGCQGIALVNVTLLNNFVFVSIRTTLSKSFFFGNISEARKKDKGGLSAVLLAAIMMKKMLAAIGIGAVGVLAAKALGVATMALVLTAIIGLKKLTESDHKSEPEVHYVKAHQSDYHHRRRRDIDENSYLKNHDIVYQRYQKMFA